MKTEQNMNRLRQKNQLKGLVRTLVLLFGSFFLLSGYTLYHLEFKQTLLETSHSPTEQHTIEFIEQGETTEFNPSTIRIKYNNQYIDRVINNNSAELKDTNIAVEWTSADTALITLDGDKQQPEFIQFNSQEKNAFDTFQMELESKQLATSLSRDQSNKIEVKEIIQSKGEEDVRFIRVFYGSGLKEFQDFDYVYGADKFIVEWVDEQRALLHIAGEIAGEKEILVSYEVDLATVR